MSKLSLCICKSFQDKLGENLKKVLENQSIPEVTLAILNLQEFMEHWGKGTLDIRNEVSAWIDSQHFV